MVDGRKVDWHYLVIASLATAVIMGGIFVAGQQLNQYKVDQIKGDIQQIELEQQSQALTFQLADTLENRCAAMKQWREGSLPELRQLSETVAAYEDARKLDNPDYPVLKKRYMNLLIENMIQVRKMESSCSEENVTEVIYLYTKDNCDRCDDQGTVLTFYRRKYSDNLLVYPLDSDLDMRPIELIEQTYNVTEYPTIIVEGEKYSGYRSKLELGAILEKRINGTEQ